jgi:hypothetical protein
MQCILYKIYFWKVFHMYYNLICIFICTPICTKFYSHKKWVLQGGRRWAAAGLEKEGGGRAKTAARAEIQKSKKKINFD